MEKYFDINTGSCSVRCKLFCNNPRDIKQAVVYCHGFAGHKDTRAAGRFAEKLLSKHKQGAVICFDWPCHGKDARGKLVLEDCSVYLDTVTEYIKNTLGVADICCYATSFGGYCVLRHIALHGMPFRKIVLRSPALKLYSLLTQVIIKEEELEKIQKGKDTAVGFDRKVNVGAAFLDDVKRCDVTGFDYMPFAEDILILHGTEDEVVPYGQSADFADNNVIELIPFEGADHRFTDPKKLDLANVKTLDFFALG